MLAIKQVERGESEHLDDETRDIKRPLTSPFDASETIGFLKVRANMAHLQIGAREETSTLAGWMVA